MSFGTGLSPRRPSLHVHDFRRQQEGCVLQTLPSQGAIERHVFELYRDSRPPIPACQVIFCLLSHLRKLNLYEALARDKGDIGVTVQIVLDSICSSAALRTKGH